MRIAYIGHPFHAKTRSNQFFMRVLQRISDNIVEFVDDVNFNGGSPDGEGDEKRDLIQDVLAGDFDMYVCWQTDRIAKMLSMLGRERVISVPMWDSSMQLPPEFWHDMHGVTFISFSLALHRMLVERGLQSHYFQYFPPAGRPETIASDHSLFFWERRPSSNISIKTLLTPIMKSGATRIHLHLAADDPREQSRNPFLGIENLDVAVSTSRWFPEQADLVKVIDSYAVYIAPREHEGIGMSFLEAMASGKVVMGPPYSTFTDYVMPGINGLLFPRDEGDLDIPWTRVKEIGGRAQEYISIGHERWLHDRDRLMEVLTTRKAWLTGVVTESHVRAIRQILSNIRREGHGA